MPFSVIDTMKPINSVSSNICCFQRIDCLQNKPYFLQSKRINRNRLETELENCKENIPSGKPVFFLILRNNE